nr:MAG TPA: GRIP domain [Caudoviricetes sp.]
MDYLRNVLLLFLKREKENLREINESRRSARWRVGFAHAGE